MKINVVYLIKLVILHFTKFVLKYDLSLMSYFIIAVLVGFIVGILIKTSDKAVNMFLFMCGRLYPRLTACHSLA